MRGLSSLTAFVAAAAALLLAGAGAALAACQVTVAGGAPGFLPAAFLPAAAGGDSVRITFAGHASFMVESPEGVGVFTDYNGVIRPKRMPDIVTMNSFHPTHYTNTVEPEIRHVLRGWDPAGGTPRHDLMVKDMRVRNIPTNFGEGTGDLASAGNSIFYMEAAGVCVVHLSHTHHVLSPAQLQPIRDADVLMVPIDGMWTMSLDEAFDIIGHIRPRLIIPMHYGNQWSIQKFVARAQAAFPLGRHDADWIDVSLKTLPQKTEVLFLKGEIY